LSDIQIPHSLQPPYVWKCSWAFCFQMCLFFRIKRLWCNQSKWLTGWFIKANCSLRLESTQVTYQCLWHLPPVILSSTQCNMERGRKRSSPNFKCSGIHQRASVQPQKYISQDIQSACSNCQAGTSWTQSRNDFHATVKVGWLSSSYRYKSDKYVAHPQSKFPTLPTASKPYIAQSYCTYVIEQRCSMVHALTVLPAFSQ
jgi:hypothetical protein